MAPPHARQSYPLTLTPAALAASHTGLNRSKLSITVQLMFFLLKASEAAPKMATSSQPASKADSSPC